MDGLTDKKHLIAWFVKHWLENAFQEIGIGNRQGKPGNRKVNFTGENSTASNNELKRAYKLTPEQASLLNRQLLTLAIKLPPFLYNAGITATIIPSSKVHIKFHNNYINVVIDDVGHFIFDIQQNKFHARVWTEAAVNEGKPVWLPEIVIRGSTSKRNLDVSFNYDSSIKRDVAYLTKKLEEYIDSNIPKAKLSERRSDLFKFKNLANQLAGVNETYQGLFKKPAWKGLINSSPVSAIQEIATARQGKGHVPGMDLLPGGKQVMEIIADDPMQQWDLDRIDAAQRIPATVKDEFGVSVGGYQSLIAQMRVYNNNWEDKFVGFYAHPETLDMMKKIGIETASVPFSDNFMDIPYDDEKKAPFEFFIYVNSEALKHDYLDLKKVGVIYVNPATE